jgi:outer membrane receptor protein involved in Fe transport
LEFQLKANRLFTMHAIAAASLLAVLPLQNAMAQAKDTTLNLDEVVVTAAPAARSKMKSSDSVSTVGEEAIVRGGATSAAEILRAIPGVRSESSGGEGNANITVRGAPISAGGGRYFQFQEDGLPVLLFGDIAFGTADQFVRTDYTTERVEVIRGGSASTQVANAPGGAANFISKTGRDAGNAVGYSMGLGSRLDRYDFNLSNTLSKDTYVNMGGFVRTGGGGAINTNFNSQDGGQIKIALTKELDKGSYIRASFKNLEDKTPSLMPVPVIGKNGQITEAPGVDPRTAYFAGNSLTRDVTVDAAGNKVVSNPMDGLRVKSRAFGLEGKINLDGGWVFDGKVRMTKNSGRFTAMFPASALAANGTFTGTLFNTSLDNMDNMFSDMKLTKTFEFGAAKMHATAGVFTGSQNVAQTWFWNQYTVNTNGSVASTTPTSTGWATWGGCCARTYDVRYNTRSPYAALQFETGALALDGSVRQNNMSASGQTIKGNGTAAWDETSNDNINYSISKLSYSLGANFSLNKDLALFARASSGYNFAGDRLLYGTKGALDGGKPVSFNQLNQEEAGVKLRAGGFNLFATYFQAKTNESNYEASTQKTTVNGYKAKGVELEAGYKAGAFRLAGGATITSAKIADSLTAAEVGNNPRRQAAVVYSLAPSVALGDFDMGASLIGSGASYADDGNTVNMPGYMVTNLFANYRVNKQALVIFGMNNAFNTLAYTEAEAGGGAATAARALPGRTAKLSLKYEF